jgi:hypothetical protein
VEHSDVGYHGAVHDSSIGGTPPRLRRIEIGEIEICDAAWIRATDVGSITPEHPTSMERR